MSEPSSDITMLLAAWNAGDQRALDRLLPVVYTELQRVARRQLRNERQGHTLQPTALVNEAYMRLVQVRRLKWQNRAHFFAMCARLMRQILVDAARARRSDRRGGDAVRVRFDEALMPFDVHGPEVVALDDALRALAALDSRKSRVVELRFFGGLSVEETAAVLRVSAETIMRDWKFAKTWLYQELRDACRATP